MHQPAFGAGSVTREATVYGREHGITVIDGGCPLMFKPTADLGEEFIYFLMVDRFQGDTARPVIAGGGRAAGHGTPNTFYGGNIRGVINNLDYIAGLGCTAIWLSPVFENNPDAYHGYDINSYLRIDPHFGTKQDLVDLVDAAHNFRKDGQPFPIRIIHDVVINHSGDNWSYPGGFRYFYFNDQQFGFGSWRRDDRPLPTELRNPEVPSARRDA